MKSVRYSLRKDFLSDTETEIWENPTLSFMPLGVLDEDLNLRVYENIMCSERDTLRYPKDGRVKR